MAIVIEQEKKKINWFALSTVVLIIMIIIIFAYYLFFAPDPLIDRVASPHLKSLEEISVIKLQPEAITNNSNFKILKRYINPIEIDIKLFGKQNLFLK